MKIILIIFSIALLAVGCSSANKSAGVPTDLQTKANTYEADLNAQGKYQRAISMVESSPNFSDVQKRELTELIGDFATKGNELKKKETQFKAILIEEELDAGGLTSMNKRVARQNLNKLDQEESKNMEQFISQFKRIAGVSAQKSETLVLQVVEIF